MSIFIYLFLTLIIYYLVSTFYETKKESLSFFDFIMFKKVLKNRERNKLFLVDFLFSLLPALLFFLLTLKYQKVNGQLYLAIISFVGVRMVQLGSIALSGQIKQSKVKRVRRHFIPKCIIASTLLIAGIIQCAGIKSNASTSAKDVIQVNKTQIITGKDANLNSDGSISLEGTAAVFYINVGTSSYQTMEFDYDGATKTTYIKIDYLDDKGALITNGTQYFYGGSTANKNQTIYKLLNIEFYSLRVETYVYGTWSMPIRLTSIRFNTPIPLVVSPLSIALITSIVSFLVFIPTMLNKLNSRKPTLDTSYRRSKNVILIGGLAAFLVIFGVSFLINDGYFISYPFNETTLYQQNCYQQLFDAFRKGQFFIDIKPDPRLLELANPYNPFDRNGIPYLFDRAFFNDKYFIYYGMAPVILIMFPLYFLTGQVALDPTIMLLGGVMMLVGNLLLLNELTKKFAPHCPLFLKNFIAFVVIVGSASFAVFGTGDSFYHIPYIYGLGFFYLFFYFALVALRDKKRRSLFLGLSGLAFVGVIQSRPNLAVGLLFVAPFYLRMLFERDRFKTKMVEFSPLAGVLILGAAWSFYYNYARFENILEFGQFYQFTVVDSTALTLKLDALPSSFVHFFFTPPNGFGDLIEFGPIMNIPNNPHPYQISMIGAFYNPLFLVLFLYPLTIRKGMKIESILTVPLIFISTIIITWMTNCYAGICPRYISDFYPLLGIISFIILIQLFELYGTKKEFNLAFLPSLLVFSLVSLYFGVSVTLNSFDGLESGDLFGIKRLIDDMLRISYFA